MLRVEPARWPWRAGTSGQWVDVVVEPEDAGAWNDAAALYGAVTAASNGAPPFGSDATRLRQSAALLRQHLTDTEFRFRTREGKQMDGSQVIHFALDAIARAAAKP